MKNERRFCINVESSYIKLAELTSGELLSAFPIFISKRPKVIFYLQVDSRIFYACSTSYRKKRLKPPGAYEISELLEGAKGLII